MKPHCFLLFSLYFFCRYNACFSLSLVRSLFSSEADILAFWFCLRSFSLSFSFLCYYSGSFCFSRCLWRRFLSAAYFGVFSINLSITKEKKNLYCYQFSIILVLNRISSSNCYFFVPSNTNTLTSNCLFRFPFSHQFLYSR